MMSGRSAGAGGDSRHGYVLLLRCWGRGGTGGLCGQWLCGVQTGEMGVELSSGCRPFVYLSTARHRALFVPPLTPAACPARHARWYLSLLLPIVRGNCLHAMAHAPPHPPPGAAPPVPLSAAHLSLLDALPHSHVAHALKTVAVPANAPPDIAGKSFALVVCSLHDQQKCDQCAVDFSPVNFLHQFLRFAPAEAIPPPPNVAPPPQRAQAVTNLKEAGNVRVPRVCSADVSPV